jgi:hypothetical protein
MSFKDLLCKIRGHHWSHGTENLGDQFFSVCTCCWKRKLYAIRAIRNYNKGELVLVEQRS